MKRSGLALLLLLTLLLQALAKDLPSETGKMLAIEKKARSRVLYYLVNTPITQDEPYYEVTVQLRDRVFVAEYTPVHASQTLPEDWQVDGTILVRVDKRYLFAKQPGESELRLVILKQRIASPGPGAPNAPAKNQ